MRELLFMHRPKITVITTTWNRASYLPRVYYGLKTQSYTDFEWIIADDGSDDETIEVVKSLIVGAHFPVILVSANVHVGKARMDNEALSVSNGEFIVWCDSDDYFYSHAFKVFIEEWESINIELRENFIGIIGLCESKSRTLNIEIAKFHNFEAKFNELEFKYKMKEDGTFFLRSKILKKHRFPEVDLVVPESSVWYAFGSMNTRVLNNIVMKKEYNSEHCISFSSQMKYNRGRAYAMAITLKYFKEQKVKFYNKKQRTINFLRYCFHGDINLKTSFHLWGDNTSRLLLLSCLFPAWILSIKDKLQGKVVKTHLEFDKAAKNAIIKSVKLN
jgi:glycosyltransferase involved in cell wall biosynthesis